jgi:hypothetical protein
MKNFDQIEEVYTTSEDASRQGWQVCRIAWPDLKLYHHSLRCLEKSLKDHELIEEWSAFLAFSKRFQFFVSTTPLAPSVVLNAMLGWKSMTSPSLARLKSISPDSVNAMVDALEEPFERLQSHAVSPMWSVALDDCAMRHPERASVAVLYSENRLGILLEEQLSSAASDNICFYPVRPADLKEPRVYHQLMVFGPTRRRFDDGSGFVFKSPRASLLTLFVPDAFRADIPPPYDLAGSPHNTKGSGGIYRGKSFAIPVVSEKTFSGGYGPHQGIETVSGHQTDNGDDDGWMEVLPMPKVDYRPFVDREPLDKEKADFISAKQVFLSADHVVYLPEDGSVYRLMDQFIDESSKWICQDVDHIDVDEVGPGAILLFSEEGGGTMIYEIANQILGQESHHLREIQNSWKSCYLLKSVFKSEAELIKELKSLGARNVTSGMVRNWRSKWNIGPGSWSNFELLLQYCDLTHRQDEIFQATRAIRRAHIQAGAQLAGRLLDLMKGQSLDELHSTGKQLFGGTPNVPTQKVAFFVQAVAPGSVDVLPNDIAQPVPIQQGSWL